MRIGGINVDLDTVHTKITQYLRAQHATRHFDTRFRGASGTKTREIEMQLSEAETAEGKCGNLLEEMW